MTKPISQFDIYKAAPDIEMFAPQKAKLLPAILGLGVGGVIGGLAFLMTGVPVIIFAINSKAKISFAMLAKLVISSGLVVLPLSISFIATVFYNLPRLQKLSDQQASELIAKAKAQTNDEAVKRKLDVLLPTRQLEVN